MSLYQGAVFAGSFDPFTLGHLDLVQRALPLFGSVTILVARNSKKTGWLPLEQRIASIQACLADLPGARVDSFEGLTTGYLRQNGQRILLRGIRNAMDWEWERAVAYNNSQLLAGCETVFLPTHPIHSATSSSLVREIHGLGGDVSHLVHAAILPYLPRVTA